MRRYSETSDTLKWPVSEKCSHRRPRPARPFGSGCFRYWVMSLQNATVEMQFSDRKVSVRRKEFVDAAAREGWRRIFGRSRRAGKRDVPVRVDDWRKNDRADVGDLLLTLMRYGLAARKRLLLVLIQRTIGAWR
jgi:hypothetical protein